MTDTEKVMSFGDMVNAAERLTKPWRVALIVTNILWAIVLSLFIAFAYLVPDTTYQYQDGQQQTQSTGTEVVTNVK